MQCNVQLSTLTLSTFKHSDVKWLHFKVFRTILVKLTLFNFLTFRHWRSFLSARVPQCQKIKKCCLNQYDAESFGRLIFATCRKSVALKGFV